MSATDGIIADVTLSKIQFISKIIVNVFFLPSLLRKSSSAKASDKCGNSTKEDKSHVSEAAAS